MHGGPLRGPRILKIIGVTCHDADTEAVATELVATELPAPSRFASLDMTE